MVEVFTNVLGEQSSIPGRVTLNIQKMVRDASLLNTQLYKVPIKSKWSNPEKPLGTEAIQKGPFGSHSTNSCACEFL